MVSAVITTYRRSPEVVLRAIKSVLSQTYTNIEVIVVDDSSDEYKERNEVENAVKSIYDGRVTYIKHNSSKGACAARNTGLKHANGEYIGFLDDDDEWMPQKVESMLRVFNHADSNLALVYCKYLYVNDDTNEECVPNEQFIGFKKGRVFDSLIIDNYIGSTSFPIIRTTCLKEIGGFDEEMLSCQDYDVWLRLAKQYMVDFIDEPLVRFHIHSNESIGKNPVKRIRGQERLCHKNIDYLQTHNEAYFAWIKRLAPMYAANGEVKNSISSIAKGVSLCPAKVGENIGMIVRSIKYYLQWKNTSV